VKVSQLEQKINKMAPLMTTVTCRSRPTTFTTETKQQCRLTKQQLPEAEFVNAVNFFHNIWNPELSEAPVPPMTSQVTENLHEVYEEQGQEDDDDDEEDLEETENEPYTHKFSSPKRKTIKLPT
jgi:hypothetical protein